MESPFGLRSLPLGFGRPQAGFFMACGRSSEPVLRTRPAAGRLFHGLRPIFGACPPDSAGRRQAFLRPAADQAFFTGLLYYLLHTSRPASLKKRCRPIFCKCCLSRKSALSLNGCLYASLCLVGSGRLIIFVQRDHRVRRKRVLSVIQDRINVGKSSSVRRSPASH